MVQPRSPEMKRRHLLCTFFVETHWNDILLFVLRRKHRHSTGKGRTRPAEGFAPDLKTSLWQRLGEFDRRKPAGSLIIGDGCAVNKIVILNLKTVP